ncbi:hypothetical protein FAZ95_14715 [Trinickia violacea]|uniref:Uncharacterized protein n=1 Tax=Trinickia violacea TaxID=2571746 RepID=A0A4P8ISR3_9BURK|nr:hypothetical protein [Trinickia violacea]QCP50313.1 hypothetical protein FAZ95_14715 [Trinickia violacea]
MCDREGRGATTVREPEETLACYGTLQAEPACDTFTVGPWSIDVVEGALRNIRFDGIEVIRAVSFLVRDRDWGTCRPAASDVTVVESAVSLHITYSAECTNPDGGALSYTVEIRCDARGELECLSRCRARTDCTIARCGFCVLHPIADVAGVPARITHTDGSIESSRFPELIDPRQPFKDIRAIEHELQSGLTVRCTLLGDVFEMEDQRNWSDASYKTYSRPLALPWPYVMAAGSAQEQVVRIEVKRRVPERGGASRVTGRDVDVHLDLAITDEVMPSLGIAVAPAEVESALANLDALAELGPQRLTLHFDPLAGHGRSELARLAELQLRSGIPAILEYVLPGVLEPRCELTTLAALIADVGLSLSGIFVTPAAHRRSDPPGSEPGPCPPLDEVYREARRVFPDVRLGGGMLSYFTELNRKRPPFDMVDWVSHATCPIVHAADDRSVMQTLEAVPHITRSCRALIGSKPYAIGPVSIGMRQNPYGSRTMSNPNRERIPMAEEDPREHARFGAAWLAGYAASLSGANIECLTLGGLTGPRGIISHSGQRYPAFYVARLLASMAGTRRVVCRSGGAGSIVGFGATDERGVTRVLVANLTGRLQSARMVGGAPLSLTPFSCFEWVVSPTTPPLAR